MKDKEKIDMKKEKLKKIYTGSSAINYNKHRIGSKYWEKEQAAVFDLLEKIKKDSGEKYINVLDIPVGTGRFFNFYKQLNFNVFGMDISEDMLQQSTIQAEDINLNVELEKGDITNINFSNNSFDLVVSSRIFNLLDFEDVSKSISEIARVSNNYFICGIITKQYVLNYSSFFQSINVAFKRIFIYLSEFFWFRGNCISRHQKEEIFKLFEINKFSIIENKRINNINSGFDYYFYLLKKDYE